VEEREECLCTIERAEEALRAREVMAEDLTVSMGERQAVGESMGEGKVFASPVAGVEGAKGGASKNR